MTIMKIDYTGNLHCDLTHEQSGAKVATDAPLDNGGKGESFSPTDLVASALAACVLTMMGKKAENLGVSLQATIKAEKIMQADPRRIKEIILNITFSDIYDEKTQKILEATAHTCPVAQSLHPDTKQTFIFHWAE